MRAIRDNLQAVNERIARAALAVGRAPESVTLLAVSKTHAASAVQEALDAGQRSFGENYVQEALDKKAALEGKDIEWHLIGPLQSNKTRAVAEHFQWVHSVDSEKIARRLSGQRSGSLAPLNVLVQVNVSGEASKSGVAPAQVDALCRLVSKMPRLKLRGLMAIPEPGAPAEQYRALKKLFDALKHELRLDTLSVGMSDDLELAIAEGATLVRIGTAIFGPRAARPQAAACTWGPRASARAGT